MSDEGFHEIQLNGKQLVFLFITVTVVSVVIFLCGVLVGRGVRAERADAAVESSVAPVPSTPEPVAQGGAESAAAGPAASQASATTDPATAAPQPADDELSYYKRLEGQTPKESLKTLPSPPPPASQTPSPAPQATTPQTPSPAAQTPPPPSALQGSALQERTKPAEPPSAAAGAIAVQIAALRDKNEADAIVRRLNAKGYQAYVISALAGAVTTYKVRVGNYRTQREAEDVKVRLEKEEQFKPWIVR